MLLNKPENEKSDVLGTEVRRAELPRYQQLSMDALRFAEYLKRYGEAFLESDASVQARRATP
jgi:hypothetical protein